MERVRIQPFLLKSIEPLSYETYYPFFFSLSLCRFCEESKGGLDTRALFRYTLSHSTYRPCKNVKYGLPESVLLNHWNNNYHKVIFFNGLAGGEMDVGVVVSPQRI